MQILKDISYGNQQIERQKLDVYLPEGEVKALLIYFHGGGLEMGSKEDVIFLAGLTEKGIGLIVPNYRLYPNARYPEFILDAAAAVKWAADYREEHHKGKRLFVAGSSAGAHLAMMLCFDEKYLQAYGLHPDAFDGYIFDAGQPTVHYNVLREAGMNPQMVAVDERAPMYHVRADRAYPSMLFLCAERDMPLRYEQTMLMLAALKQFGHGEKVSFQYMDGYDHCEYDDKPVFQELLIGIVEQQYPNIL